MAKKPTKKKRSGKKTLASTLKGTIKSRLLDLEKKGRAIVRDELFSLLNPSSGQASKSWEEASERVEEIAEELSKHELYPWVHAHLSAVAFEGIYAGCVHSWLLAGEPDNKAELVPAVDEYVRLQAKSFAAAVGADLKKQTNA